MIETLPLTVHPKLINEIPRTWAYPLPISPMRYDPEYGVYPILLGPWEWRNELWRVGATVKFSYGTPDPLLIPLLIVTEYLRSKFYFSLALYDHNSYLKLGLN